jgi:hypothetical protein
VPLWVRDNRREAKRRKERRIKRNRAKEERVVLLVSFLTCLVSVSTLLFMKLILAVRLPFGLLWGVLILASIVYNQFISGMTIEGEIERESI